MLLLMLLILPASADLCSDGQRLGCTSLSVNGSAQYLNCSDPFHPRHGCPEGSSLCCVQSATQSRVWPVLEVSASGLIIVVLGCFCCIWILKRRRSKDASLPPISRSHIEKHFPEVPIDSQPPCVICLANIEGMGRKLQCEHAFHSECILQWWTHVPRGVLECPICKQVQMTQPGTNPEEQTCKHPIEGFAQSASMPANIDIPPTEASVQIASMPARLSFPLSV